MDERHREHPAATTTDRTDMTQATQSTAAWEKLASTDPLWAICVRKDVRGGRWDVEDFFATGRSEIEWATGLLSQLGQLLATVGTAVDFGCGAGRLAQALLPHASDVVGVDASATMRAHAARLADERLATGDRDRLRIVESLTELPTGSADLVYSSLVLQHLPPGVLPEVLRQIRRVLRPAGVALLHLPTGPAATLRGIGWRVLPDGVIAALQVRVLRYPAPMTMHWLPPDRMLELLQAQGLTGSVHTGGPRHSPDWRDAWYAARPVGAPQ